MYCGIILCIGYWVHLRCRGFKPSVQMFQAFGMAVLHMAQHIRKHSRMVRDGERGLLVSDASCSRINKHSDSSKMHVFGYRDLADLAVRYRQWSDASGIVYWLNNFPDRKLTDLYTLLVWGGRMSLTYSSQYAMAFNVTRHKVLRNGYNLVGSRRRFVDTTELYADVREDSVSSLPELYTLTQNRSHWIASTCTSRTSSSTSSSTTRYLEPSTLMV